jgi:hypothetical protein
VGTFLVAVVAAFASGLVLVAILGRYRESAWLPDWEDILTPAGQQRYEELQERFGHEVAASRFTFERARAAFEKGETEVASRLLEAGYEYVAALALDRERLLRTLARHARMMGAVAPLPPLRPGQFQLRELATLAGLGWLVHQVLATVPERSRLRLDILRRGQTMALRVLLGAAHGATAARIDSSHWVRIDAAHNDWCTIDRESLASLGSVLSTLLQPVGDSA